MKLLLTSSGLVNESIANALNELTGKEPKDVKIAFFLTAANPERSNKDWLIKDLYRIHRHGYYVDLIDLPAFSQDKLKVILEDADVIFVGGGNAFYLSYWMQKSGMSDLLPELLKTRVYAGISAGSMIAGQSLQLSSQAISNIKAFKNEDYNLIGPEGESSGETFKLADIVFRPHLNDRLFSSANIDLIKEKSQGLKFPVYALDDNSALKIIDGNIEVVSEGDWQLIENSSAL